MSRTCSVWDHVRSGASHIVLKAAVGHFGRTFDRSGIEGERDLLAQEEGLISRVSSGEGGVFERISSSSFVRAPSGGGGFSRISSIASQKSNTAAENNKGEEGEAANVHARFLFWRWPGVGPQDPEARTSSGHWVVADNPSAEEAALCVESDASHPSSIDASAQWMCWKDSEWAAPGGGFRIVSSDGKMNPDAAKKKLVDHLDYFRTRRHDDEANEHQRQRLVSVQANVITHIERVQSHVSTTAEGRLRNISHELVSQRPSAASGGSLSRRPSISRAPSARR